MKLQIRNLMEHHTNRAAALVKEFEEVSEKRRGIDNNPENAVCIAELRKDAIRINQLRLTHQMFASGLRDILNEEQVAIINPGRTEALKVRFKKPIFEDDFPDTGMLAWLTAVREYHCDGKAVHYELFFDFTEFEEHNDKYLQRTYYPNSTTGGLGTDKLFTAKEAGYYNNKYSAYFGDLESEGFNNEEAIRDILEVINE